MDKAKIRLSSKEAELVKNADWILTKNGILQKVKYILEQLQTELQEFAATNKNLLPAEVMQVPPKISRGEQYRGLPWLILDYPRYFEKDNHFAIRSMFWWGHFFSTTLHLSGNYKKAYAGRLEQHFSGLQEAGMFICVNENEWEHHFDTDNYLPLSEMRMDDWRTHTSNKPFMKLASKYSLDQWDNSSELLLKSFTQIVRWISH